MNTSDKFEKTKREIRSMLIAYRSGCSLSEFLNGYKQLTAQKLPYRELGFKSDIDLLYSMPDAVYITSRGSDYHLMGIADEKSLHIQKLVGRQKETTKKKTSHRIPSRYSMSRRDYETPPRLKAYPSEEYKVHASLSSSAKENLIFIVKMFPNGIKIEEFLPAYEKHFGRNFSFQNYGYLSLLDCIEKIPELRVEKTEKSAVIYAKTNSDTSKIEEKATDSHNLQLQKNFVVQTNSHFVGTSEEKSCTKEAFDFSDPQSSIKSNSRAEILDSSERKSVSKVDGKPGVPEFVKLYLRKLIQKYPQGIWAAEFPSRYEEVAMNSFDLHSMGYNYLADFIDDVPNILIRKSVVGSKKDWLIYPSDAFESDIKGMVPDTDVSLPKGGALFIDYITLNIKKILEGYPEGLKFEEFLHVYSINCNDPLYVKDLGFDSVEAFLLSISNRVPLKIMPKDGCKTIYLLSSSEHPVNSSVCNNEVFSRESLPCDAASPDSQFSEQKLPSDFDFSKYIPVYTSSIAHPGLLYIQLQGSETSDILNSLYDEIEIFYNGPYSSRYLMKNVHIKVGASCIALWPSDQHWYRAQIISIPSMEFVQVFYVDYGTKDTIPTTMLRYIKKEYMMLPAQAVKSQLAFLKPTKNAAKWDIESKHKLLQMCKDVSLMAKVEEVASDGVLSLILCDTNGKEDLYINDILLKEGLADSIVNEDYENLSDSSQGIPGGVLGVSPLQALQVQCYLQACVAIAPSLKANEHFISLLKQLSLNCASSTMPNSVLQQQMANMMPNPFGSPTGNPFLNTMLGNQNVLMNPFLSSQGLFNSNFQQQYPVNEQVTHSLSPTSTISQEHFMKPTKDEFPVNNSFGLRPIDDAENDIFHDDEDLFEQYCQEVCSGNRRFVKRVSLGDNYKIHVIVVNASPYASSGDISALIWNNKEPDYLYRRLQIKEVDLHTVVLSENGNEAVFQQLEKYGVKGIKKTSGSKSSILLYPLKSVIKILNMFGHPSVSVRTKLTEEIAEFNLSDPTWHDYSESEIPEKDEDNHYTGVTDDDKINKLCLYDLLAMKEGIRCRRLKIMNNLKDPNKSVDEIGKLEQLHSKVLDRIQEIKEICTLFS